MGDPKLSSSRFRSATYVSCIAPPTRTRYHGASLGGRLFAI